MSIRITNKIAVLNSVQACKKNLISAHMHNSKSLKYIGTRQAARWPRRKFQNLHIYFRETLLLCCYCVIALMIMQHFKLVEVLLWIDTFCDDLICCFLDGDIWFGRLTLFWILVGAFYCESLVMVYIWYFDYAVGIP